MRISIIMILVAVVVFGFLAVSEIPTQTAYGQSTGKTIQVNLSFIESTDFKVYAFNALSGADMNPTVQANVGDSIVFHVTNNGKSFHAFAVTASATGPGPAIDGTTVGTADSPMKPGTSGQVTFVPSAAGTYYYICAVPGHRELGMEGKIIVTQGSSSQQQPISITTDKSSYSWGDTVIITGHVENLQNGTPVALRDFKSYSIPASFLSYPDYVYPNSNGDFIQSFMLLQPWTNASDFTLVAQYGSTQANTTFHYNSPSETPTAVQLRNCMQIGGASVELDKTHYEPNDVVNIAVTAPSCNSDPNAIDVIGDGPRGIISITTHNGTLESYRLAETGVNTGIFTGNVTLYETMMPSYHTSGKGPTDGVIGTSAHDGISVSFTRTGWGGTVTASAIISSYNTTQVAGPSNPNTNVTTAYNILHGNNQTISLSNMSPLSVNTDLPSYKSGDTIVTTGHIRDLQSGTSVTVEIYDPNDIVISASQLVPNADGSFTKTFQAGGPLWNNAGDYTIVAQYGKYTQASTAFNYIGQTSATSLFTPTQQDIQNINQAKDSQTIAAEVNVGTNNMQTTSIDNNVSVQTTQDTPDSLGVQVSASSQTGPKVIAFNLSATTINVQNLKDLGVMYDGKSISPAPNMDAILHAKPTDNPSFAIVVTQSGVQVLVLVPHFSTHTITITNMSQVIPVVPEFPFAILVLMMATFSIVLISTYGKKLF
ncbi:MAG: multicopper oxidase domain-containing protein [Nitrosotalea sp.]